MSANSSQAIDDNPRNIAAARSVGMRGIVFKSYEELIKELEEL